jgi:hypothetical protein
MRGLEQLLGLFIAAVILAGAARRVGAPYPVFLALGDALLAFLPGAPSFTVPPELALALFIAPVLLDAAYDASLRDLRDNWAPVTSWWYSRSDSRPSPSPSPSAHAYRRCHRDRRLRLERSWLHPTPPPQRPCSVSCDRHIAS